MSLYSCTISTERVTYSGSMGNHRCIVLSFLQILHNPIDSARCRDYGHWWWGSAPGSSLRGEALMSTEISSPMSRVMDDTLTPGERLQFIEALFVHDADQHWCEMPTQVVDVARVAPVVERSPGSIRPSVSRRVRNPAGRIGAESAIGRA